VPAHIGVQPLLLGAEGVEQVQGQLPVVSFVVSLQQDLQWNGELPGLLEHGAGHDTAGEQKGGRDARLEHRQPDWIAGAFSLDFDYSWPRLPRPSSNHTPTPR
jgi:hypothetical protein